MKNLSDAVLHAPIVYASMSVLCKVQAGPQDLETLEISAPFVPTADLEVIQ
jgi:hypothetical protein